MLGALSQRYGQYRVGRYLDIGNDVEVAPIFQYEVIQGERATYSQIIANLITQENSTIIKTNYGLEWKMHGKVLLQNGKIYIITNFERLEEEVQPQSFSIMREGSDVSYYIELLEVDNADNTTPME